MSHIAGLTFVLLLAAGFYVVLSFGAAESLRQTFVPAPTPTWTPAPAEATRTPIPTPTAAPTITPNPSAPGVNEDRDADDRGGDDRNQPRNRMNCNEIRGTQYLSPAERQWYLSNCLGGSQPTNQQTSGGPSRANCDAIRGTQYLSQAERAWYLTFCT